MKKQYRYLYLIISIVSMCLYGYGFILTVFTSSLEEAFNCTAKESSMVFTVCLVMFSLGCLVTGYLYHAMKLKTLFLISTVMMGLGVLLTAKAPSIEVCYATFGALYGFGAGIGYKSQLTAMVAWFPEKSGFAAGVLFMGTGLTAMIFNMPLNHWIENYGWRNAFAYLGWITVVLLIINVIIVKPYPKDPFSRTGKAGQLSKMEDDGMTTGQMLRTARFWLFFLWSILLCGICMTVASNSVASAISIGVSSATAAFFSGLISLSNSISRIIYGLLYDKKGQKISMAIAMVFLAISILFILLGLKLGNPLLLVTGYIFMGICYGSVNPISSSYTLQIFGSKHYSENYSIQGLFMLISTFTGPLFIGNIFAVLNSYYKTYLILIPFSIMTVASLAILNMMSETKKKA